MRFKLKTRKAGPQQTPVIVIAGDVTGSCISKISAKLEDIRNNHTGTIAIDLSETTFIDSHGLGVFVFFFRRLSEENRRLVFLNPSPFIRDLFTGSNLSQIFSVIDSEDAL